MQIPNTDSKSKHIQQPKHVIYKTILDAHAVNIYEILIITYKILIVEYRILKLNTKHLKHVSIYLITMVWLHIKPVAKYLSSNNFPLLWLVGVTY